MSQCPPTQVQKEGIILRDALTKHSQNSPDRHSSPSLEFKEGEDPELGGRVARGERSRSWNLDPWAAG